MKLVFSLLLFLSFTLKSQQTIKVKREDNRFLFFQIGSKSDTLIKNKTDLFLIKFPDSLQTVLQLYVENGQFEKTKTDSIYRLLYVAGMKYSHTKYKTVFNTLVEGNCTPSKNIIVNFKNTGNQKNILQNSFWVK